MLTPAPRENPEGTFDYAFTPYVLEMHGNVRYMHCSAEEKDCSRVFFKSPTLEDATDRTNHVPHCKECGATMKPHCMFFDECYNEHYYRDSTTTAFQLECDALIVIGTAL